MIYNSYRDNKPSRVAVSIDKHLYLHSIMSTRSTYTITAALPYANGPMHIGHFAGVYLPADIYARYLRKKGHEVAFISGSDEGGAAITLQAYKQGITPQTLVDTYHTLNKKVLADFGVSFDIFSRTSHTHHHKVASDFFLNLHQKGLLEEKESEQYYDPQLGIFLADRYLKGICPHCSFQEAYGDQCESCGSTLSPQELLEVKSTVSGATLIKKRTQHWYLPLGDYEDWLKQWILEDHTDWKANVYGQCKSWLQAGLKSRAITRDLDWGIKVPLPDTDGKVLYVWFEAPIGYISATQEWAETHGKDWKKFWKDPQTRLVHFIGKDNIVFHCLIFPSMLKAHGDYILPYNVPGNEFMNLEGKKISTSRNHAIWLHEYLEQHPGKEDVLRYVLCANMPETKDSDFTWADFQTKNNSELVAILGNFVHRTLILCHKYFEGEVPPLGTLKAEDQEVQAQLATITQAIGEHMEAFKFRQALARWMDLARLGNKYLADSEPWKVWKTDPSRVETILHIALQIITHITLLGEPFLPFTSKKLADILDLSLEQPYVLGKFDYLTAHHQLKQPVLLFEKIED